MSPNEQRLDNVIANTLQFTRMDHPPKPDDPKRAVFQVNDIWIEVTLGTSYDDFLRQLDGSRMPHVLHGEQMLDSHFRGVTEKGQPFFYCPVGRIVSWSPGDHDNKWCHFEGKYVETIE